MGVLCVYLIFHFVIRMDKVENDCLLCMAFAGV